MNTVPLRRHQKLKATSDNIYYEFKGVSDNTIAESLIDIRRGENTLAPPTPSRLIITPLFEEDKVEN